MRYQSKPSDKIFTTESTGSIKTNFPLSHIDGHIVGRLFFCSVAQSHVLCPLSFVKNTNYYSNNNLTLYAYVNITEKPQLDFHQRLHA